MLFTFILESSFFNVSRQSVFRFRLKIKGSIRWDYSWLVQLQGMLTWLKDLNIEENAFVSLRVFRMEIGKPEWKNLFAQHGNFQQKPGFNAFQQRAVTSRRKFFDKKPVSNFFNKNIENLVFHHFLWNVPGSLPTTRCPHCDVYIISKLFTLLVHFPSFS